MQVPIRKPGKYTHQRMDAHMTKEKYVQLAKDVEKWKKIIRPRLAEEVKRLAAFGDFSENAEYQIAKGKLRGLNQRILETEDLLKRSVIIEPSQSRGIVCLGNKVTVEIAGSQKIYTILGSTETDPARGIISHKSPIGSALIGRRVGDIISVVLRDKETEYRIIKIE